MSRNALGDSCDRRLRALFENFSASKLRMIPGANLPESEIYRIVSLADAAGVVALLAVAAGFLCSVEEFPLPWDDGDIAVSCALGWPDPIDVDSMGGSGEGRGDLGSQSIARRNFRKSLPKQIESRHRRLLI
jgi:hypothetical protein